MKHLYFVGNFGDNHQTIVTAGSGASELLFYMTAYHLHRSHKYKVTVVNRFSETPVQLDGMQYVYLPEPVCELPPVFEPGTIVIVQRHFGLLMSLHQLYPQNQYILWSHDYLFPNVRGLCTHGTLLDADRYFHQHQIPIVAVSEFHKQNIRENMPRARIVVIYNALFRELYPRTALTAETYDKNRVIYASSWSTKGIQHVLRIGAACWKRNPAFQLWMLKPGYCSWNPDLREFPFVRVIGTVYDKADYCGYLQSSLCVLSTRFPETFGCVFAEALHLGVPVVGDTSVNSAIREIIPPEHLCNFDQVDQVVDMIESFRAKRPTPRLADRFYSESVLAQWQALFASFS